MRVRLEVGGRQLLHANHDLKEFARELQRCERLPKVNLTVEIDVRNARACAFIERRLQNVLKWHGKAVGHEVEAVLVWEQYVQDVWDRRIAQAKRRNDMRVIAYS